MSARLSTGRAALLLVLIGLLLTVAAGIYLFFAHNPGGLAPSSEPAAGIGEKRQFALLLLLLISALLILLFVLGAYLLINVGRLIARDRVGGKPTVYTDAWQNYRLTDEQISAATSEDPPQRGPRPPRDSSGQGPTPDEGED
jgi:hypothetical protein